MPHDLFVRKLIWCNVSEDIKQLYSGAEGFLQAPLIVAQVSEAELTSSRFSQLTSGDFGPMAELTS